MSQKVSFAIHKNIDDIKMSVWFSMTQLQTVQKYLSKLDDDIKLHVFPYDKEGDYKKEGKHIKVRKLKKRLNWEQIPVPPKDAYNMKEQIKWIKTMKHMKYVHDIFHLHANRS